MGLKISRVCDVCILRDRLTKFEVGVLVCKDNAEPSRRGTEEGLTTAQNHLVSEETPPQRQLLLEGPLSEVLKKHSETEVTQRAHRNCLLNVYT